MTRELLLEVLRPEEIPHLLDEIHDWWFDLDLLGPHPGEEVELEFRLKCSDFGRNDKPSKFLVIEGVSGYELEDTERIGCYDVNKIFYDQGVLQITTGVPLTLRFFVRELRVRLYQSVTPASELNA